jgi:hypothetical protein
LKMFFCVLRSTSSMVSARPFLRNGLNSGWVVTSLRNFSVILYGEVRISPA